MKVLVVDDNELNVYQLKVLLSGNGYEVATALNGAEALDQARRQPPDLIIADVLMPVMDGFSLCREWKKDERLKTIPFVFYSATYTDERDREFALSLGAQRFIVKPEEPELFIQTIREIIRLTEQGDEPLLPGATAAPSPAPLESSDPKETKYLRQYNEVLIHKLEDKLVQLEQVRRELEQDIVERKQTQEALRQTRDELEARVQERTAELQRSNQELERTIATLQRREQEIQRLNRQLELRLNELESANKELESFSYSVSHDLRAPLRSIDGFSTALVDDYGDKLDNQGKQFLQIIREATKRMGQLIDDLLGLSQVTRTKLCRERTDLSALAQSIVDELRKAEPTRAVSFVRPPSITAQADANLMRIVLQNLLANAWKFTSKQAQPRIEFGTTEDQGETRFFVRDNGAGFAMAHADRLFNAFQRLHSAKEFPGTGIGLAIVHHVIQRHGGRVWAQGEPDKGACFFFTLPPAPE